MSTRHADGLEPVVLLRRLGVHYALGGSCTRIGEQVRLTLELVFAEDQRVIWSCTLGVPMHDLVANPAATMAELGREVLAAIEAHETGRARSMPLASLGSYALMLGGVRLMHRLSRADFERSHQIFEALVARHPRHPDGHAWLAKWHILQLHQGWAADPGRTLGMAHDLARRALEHDDACGLAMVVSGMVKTFGERKLDEAERIYQRTLERHPSEPLAWLLKSMVHAFRGEGDEAVRHARQASALSPLDPMRYYFDSLGASAEASAGHYDRAIELARRSLAANAMHASTLRILTIAYAMQDRLDEAREVVRRLRELEPDFTVARFLQRSPSADYAVGRTYAEALARAGVPR
jgi:tetratricopeptide (TPR) repeat protein